MRVILGQPLDVVVERVQATCGHDPGLPERPAEHLLPAPRLVDQLARAGEHRPDRRPQALGEVDPGGVEPARVIAPPTRPTRPPRSSIARRPYAPATRAGGRPRARPDRLRAATRGRRRGSSSARPTRASIAACTAWPRAVRGLELLGVKMPPAPSSTRTISPDSTAGPPASELIGCEVRSRTHLVAAGRACSETRSRCTSSRWAGIPPPACRATSATRSSSACVVGSSPRCSSADHSRSDRRPHALCRPGLGVAVQVDRRHSGQPIAGAAQSQLQRARATDAPPGRSTSRPDVDRSSVSRVHRERRARGRRVHAQRTASAAGRSGGRHGRTRPGRRGCRATSCGWRAVQGERHQRTAIGSRGRPLNRQARRPRRADPTPPPPSACSWARIASIPIALDPVDRRAQPDRLGDLRRPASNFQGRSVQVDSFAATVRIMWPPPMNGGISSSSARRPCKTPIPVGPYALWPVHA